jgi:hypothetical protein
MIVNCLSIYVAKIKPATIMECLKPKQPNRRKLVNQTNSIKNYKNHVWFRSVRATFYLTTRFDLVYGFCLATRIANLEKHTLNPPNIQ